MANGNGQQGAVAKAFSWLLGANWKTSLSGYATMAALAIHEKPLLIAWVPEPAKGFIWNLSEYAFAAGFLLMANRMKDKSTTGGSVQQDLSGQPVPEHKAELVQVTKIATPLENRP